MPLRRSSRRGAAASSAPRREEPEEDILQSQEEEEEEEDDEDFYSDDDDDDDFDDDEESSDDSDDDGNRPGELTVTTAGGVRVVLARSEGNDAEEEEEEAERATLRGWRRRLEEEEAQLRRQATQPSDPETAAAAAASAARLAHELSLRCTPAGPRGSPALREMMMRMCNSGGEGRGERAERGEGTVPPRVTRRSSQQQQEQQQQQQQQEQQRRSPRRSSSVSASAAAPLPSSGPPSPTTPPPLAAASATLSAAAILRARERGAAGRGASSSSAASSQAGLSAAARAYLTTKAFAPTAVAGLGDAPRPSRAYVGFYTASGNLFVCGYQNDRRIRVYECGPEGLGGVVAGGGSGNGDGDANDDDDGGRVVGECGWRLVKDISCRLLRWTVTDALCVPGPGGSEAKLLYSTISPTVHAVALSSSSAGFEDDDDDDDDGGDGGENNNNGGRNRNRRSRGIRSRVTSIANTTDVHEPLNFDEMLGAPPDEVLPGFGIWSIRWNPASPSSPNGGGGGNSTVLAGASDGCCYLFDAERGKTVARYARAHDDDVNAVVYLAGGGGGGGGAGGAGGAAAAPSSSPAVFASGSDDSYIKVWDTRAPSMAATGSSVAGNNGSGSGSVAFHAVARPVGVLVGHGAGITHLDSRGDGHHLLSNSKDQTAKLWDLRSGLRSPAAAAAAVAAAPAPPRVLSSFDYRWMPYPRAARGWRHGADASAVTFRGHEVLSTLIRARFSPLESTEGRFCYSGSSDGRVRIWDLATGELVRSLPAGLRVAGRAAARASRREEEEDEEDEDEDGNARALATPAAATPAASADDDGFGPLDPVRDVSWHPSGTALAAASFDGSITVFGPRGCRRRGGGGGGAGNENGGSGVGGLAPRRVSMLPIQDDDDDGDEDYEPGEN